MDADELLRLQRIVIGDDRFVTLGFRADGGFVGRHDRSTRVPLPEHISARPEDVPRLVEGMIAFDRGAAQGMDALLAATVLAFGFVSVHPFEDGKGRLHRYRVHHVLSARGFDPPGVVFPVSSAILERIDAYRETLRTYSRRLLPLVRWTATEECNVRVLDDTHDFYRFSDTTPHAEFLYECVRRSTPERRNSLRWRRKLWSPGVSTFQFRLDTAGADLHSPGTLSQLIHPTSLAAQERFRRCRLSEAGSRPTVTRRHS